MDTSSFEELCEFKVDSDAEIESLEKDDPACSASSAHIKQFVQVDDGMISSEVRAPGEPEYVDHLLHNTVRVFYSETPLPSGAFSVTVNSYEFPPTLSMRKPTTLLRPVIIDGCAVSRCFNKKYSPYCEKVKNTEKVSWYSCKVLFLEPIFKCLVHFLLRGHKVSVLLPSYYLSAPSIGIRPKVDNAEAFNLLMNLNLLRFIEPGKLGSIADTIKEAVNEVDALLVSSPLCIDSQKTSPRQRASASGAGNLGIHPAFTKASERMVTPIFFGRNCQEMSMIFNIHVKQGGRWLDIPEDLLCMYESNLNDNIDDEEKLQQQLLFKDQAELLTSIKDAYEWKHRVLWRRIHSPP
ncbi:hypothetical protein KIN20_032004 [Parelaphostrongylus tenuis]|uniref:Zc3h12a-like Ribonuclease NYN domain-containing protein n=1 Tax=Parelaphostrongylus tenuis TaxID=148309 RepID=A0AAD5WHQ4_PARTN|nr:hypothetical protein KIN20_032004 [Parelaphostrongylus tenuis]